ncbi:MAG: acyltransferase [Verrucomicrobiota bacterium]|nr:acyltransferase [Verrucomicrobiota bacterium]
MTLRAYVGACVSYLYNDWVGRVPCEWVRLIYLRQCLKKLDVNSGVQSKVVLLNPFRIEIGRNSVINFGSLLDGRKFNIIIGENVSIGPFASILTLGHDPQSPEFADEGGEVIIGDRAWIGYGAMILPGVRIGEGAIVGAGSVVTKNVEPYTIVAGNPAREVGKRVQPLTYNLSYHPFMV